jgi:hypothetical protein
MAEDIPEVVPVNHSGRSPNTRLKLLLGAVGGVVMLAAGCLVCGCGGFAGYRFYLDSSTLDERRAVRRFVEADEGATTGPPVITKWEAADLVDDKGQPIRVVRVQYHFRNRPQRQEDELFPRRTGVPPRHDNPYGDDWKRKANGQVWYKEKWDDPAK